MSVFCVPQSIASQVFDTHYAPSCYPVNHQGFRRLAFVCRRSRFLVLHWIVLNSTHVTHNPRLYYCPSPPSLMCPT